MKVKTRYLNNDPFLKVGLVLWSPFLVILCYMVVVVMVELIYK